MNIAARVQNLADADEAFLTSSLRGIAPLVRIDGRAIGKGTVGEITRGILRSYAALVEHECKSPDERTAPERAR